MRRNTARTLRLAAVGLLTTLSLATSRLAAAEDGAKPISGTLSFVRLFTDADGVSHFAEETLKLEALGTEGMEAALAVNRIGDVREAQFAMLKSGTREDWHTAPRRQILVCLRGLVEVTAGDGEKRRVKPGEIVLLEDLSGTGHITHVVGSEDHVALALPLPDGTLTRQQAASH